MRLTRRGHVASLSNEVLFGVSEVGTNLRDSAVSVSLFLGVSQATGHSVSPDLVSLLSMWPETSKCFFPWVWNVCLCPILAAPRPPCYSGWASVRVDTDAEQTRTCRSGSEHDGSCVCTRECTQTRLACLSEWAVCA